MSESLPTAEKDAGGRTCWCGAPVDEDGGCCTANVYHDWDEGRGASTPALLQRLRDLHRRDPQVEFLCGECSRHYPCRTIRTIDGDADDTAHNGCVARLADAANRSDNPMHGLRGWMVVSETPPEVVVPEFPPLPVTCPHGVRLWAYPDGARVAALRDLNYPRNSAGGLDA